MSPFPATAYFFILTQWKKYDRIERCVNNYPQRKERRMKGESLLADDVFVQNVKSDLRKLLAPVVGEVLRNGMKIGLNTQQTKECVLQMMDMHYSEEEHWIIELARRANVIPVQMRSFSLQMFKELLDEVLGDE
ncbi:MAG: hypothetical protein Greene071436_126 [Parcubacteria group bacterium Greene0714_36]|nr:MAG: hypothetical protein Greene071436_126 [Parcubacteria group bacterium Greene0714_36]